MDIIKKFLERKPKSRYIIEIGMHFVKVVYYQLPDKIGWTEVKDIANLSNREISELIKNIFSEKKVKDPLGILCFPRNLLTIGILHLPSVDYDEIAQMVMVNASRQVPFPKEEIAPGWHIISKDESGYTDVFLVILQRSLVRRYLGILASAGLEVEDIEVSSQAVMTWLLTRERELLDSQKAFFILNVEYDSSDLLVCSGRNILTSHLISQGKKDLSDIPGVARFVGEFKQLMGMMPASLRDATADIIFLCGAEKSFDALEKPLAEELKLKVQSIKTERAFAEEVSFAALLGAVYRKKKQRIAFDITEIKIKKEWKNKIRQFIYLGSVTIYLLLIALAIFLAQIYKRTHYLEKMQAQYVTIAKESQELGVLLKKIKLIEQVKSVEDSFIYYLAKISDLAFPTCQVTSFEFERNKKIVMKGKAVKMSDVFNFISQLENSNIFLKVDTRYTKKIREDNEQRNEFELSCYIR